MVEVVAKKYTKAIINTLNVDLESFLKDLEKFVSVFSVEKFLDIIHSPHISKSNKQDFLLQLVESESNKFNNFVKLLVNNDRIDIAPFVYKGLQSYISQKNKTYIGILYLNKEITSDMLNQIAMSLSSRLRVDLKIEQVVVKIDGIKLVVDDLDIEVSFSRENFINELKSYVLKAI